MGKYSAAHALAALGVVFVLHAAFSFVHLKKLAKVQGFRLDGMTSADAGSEQFNEDTAITPFSTVPGDIVVEAILGFVVALAGASSLSGPFKPARATEARSRLSYDVVDTRPDFYIFNHRGTAIAKRIAQ